MKTKLITSSIVVGASLSLAMATEKQSPQEPTAPKNSTTIKLEYEPNPHLCPSPTETQGRPSTAYEKGPNRPGTPDCISMDELNALDPSDLDAQPQD